MELAKINQLLQAYEEGQTSLQEERELRDYFKSNQVAPEHQVYKIMFSNFTGMEAETYNKPVSVGQKTSGFKPWRYAVAALLVVALTVGYFSLPNDGLTSEEREALAKFEEFKTHMELISGELNDGIENLAYLKEFDSAKEQIFK